MKTATSLKALGLVILATSGIGAAMAQDATISSKKRVAVASLDPSTAYGSEGRGGLGDNAADMLTTELVDMGAIVVERSQLNKAEQEGEMGMSGIVDAGTAQKLGRKVGAHWMVVGKITEFGVKERKMGLGKLLGIGGAGIGGDSEARVKIDARIVDIKTGIIVATASGTGSEKQGAFNIQGGTIGKYLGGVDFSSSEWLDSRMGKALRKATHDLAINFSKKWSSAEQKCKVSIETESDEENTSPASNSVSNPPKADLSVLSGMSAIVVIPETIFLRPHVPDPAAETEVIRQCVNAGIRVIDDARAKDLNSDRAMNAMMRGTVNPAKLEELRQTFGADILIVGEAIAERNAVNGNTNSIFSRARVEIRAIRMDTGQIMASDAEQGSGRDLSEALAGKNSLQNTAKTLTPRFLNAMATQLAAHRIAAVSSTMNLEIEVAGWKSLGSAGTFLTDLKAIPGVKSATRKGFRGGVLFATLEIDRKGADALAEGLETRTSMKRYRLTVQTASSAKIEAKVGL